MGDRSCDRLNRLERGPAVSREGKQKVNRITVEVDRANVFLNAILCHRGRGVPPQPRGGHPT